MTKTTAFDLVASQPWAMQPDMLETIAAIARREGEGVEAVEARTGRPLQNARKASVRGDVAIIPVTGPIFRYANLMTEISGATSLDVMVKDFTTADDDPAIKTIVMVYDTPGGQATGIAEAATLIRNAKKPVIAYVDGMAASAGYWLASAANQIVISRNGIAGNVGAVLGYDLRKDPNRGEIVSSQSPNKRPDLGTDQGKAQMQVLVDAQAQVFIDDVATHRGMTAEAVVSEFGGGDMFTGAKAVDVGMADRVGTLEEIIAGLAGKQQSKPATSLSLKGKAMTLEELRAAHPDLCAVLVEEGRTVGATAERQRIADIQSLAMPGHDALIAQFVADGKTTGPVAAVAILKAERAVCADRAEQLVADAPKPVAHAAAPDDKPAAASDATTKPDSAAAFDACIAQHVAAGKTRGQAISLAVRDNPQAHAAWIAAQNKE